MALMRGFTSHATAILKADSLTKKEHNFLTKDFDGARERMTNMASTVGTAGSFVLVLVALLVSLANGVNSESDKLLAASQTAALGVQGCSDRTSSTVCDRAKLNQALASVRRAQKRVSDTGRLNKAQALAGGFVVIGFLLGLGGVLINPVPGPDAVETDGNGVKAWRTANKRLKRKRNWIMASLVFQLCAIASIGYLGAQVF